MTVRLGFAIAINVDPEILIIDEVLAVGDSSFQQKCHEKIEDFKHEGRTIILVSHGLGEVAQLCKTVAWIEKGHLKRIGDGYDVIGDYVGDAHDATVRQSGEVGERWGTREVEITNVEFLGSDKKPIESIRSGSNVNLRINFIAHDKIPELVAGFRISHLHGTNIWGTNTKRRGVLVGPVHGPGYIDIEIDQFPLLSGTYDLTIALTDSSEVHSFDHWEKGLRFDVSQGRIFDEGLVSFPAKFTHG
jgi:ABC-2 type transport system ATP-binding protein